MATAPPQGEARTIHTLGARDNVMFDVTREYFELTPEMMQRQIHLMLSQIEQVLSAKGIEYHKLRSGLTPQVKRRELALFFDTSKVAENFYGRLIHARVIPLLSQESTHSVLTGDYIGSDDHQDALYTALVESVSLVRSVTWRHSNQFYVVYINNLSNHMAGRIHQGLSDFAPYVGSADMTYASRLKVFLSTMLVNDYLVHRSTVLMGHEDDLDNSQDVNIRGYPFEEAGYRVRSLQGLLFESFLSYKIERPVFPGFESDTEFSITGVHVPAVDLKDLTVEVPAAKFRYLAEEKLHQLRGLGLDEDSSPSELETLIAQKVASNYIYDMSYDPEHRTTKFTIMLEHRSIPGSPFRTLAALKYAPDDGALQLITLT